MPEDEAFDGVFAAHAMPSAAELEARYGRGAHRAVIDLRVHGDGPPESIGAALALARGATGDALLPVATELSDGELASTPSAWGEDWVILQRVHLRRPRPGDFGPREVEAARDGLRGARRREHVARRAEQLVAAFVARGCFLWAPSLAPEE